MTTRKTRDAKAPPQPASVQAEAPPLDFEKALADLEGIVDRLEEGDLTLEESLKEFERGIELTRQCQTALKQAEQKVEILLRKTGEPEAFEPTASEPSDFEAD